MTGDLAADSASLFTHSSPGAGLVYGAVRLSLMCYLVSVVLLIAGDRSDRWWRAARWFWTAGFTAFLVHFLSALHFAHRWSHQHALEVTSRRTAETVGVAFGEGIYVNHLFLLVWGADVIWMWMSHSSYRSRPAWIGWAVHLFLLFIVFHATVTFGQGAIRWWGLGGMSIIFVARALIPPVRPAVELAGEAGDPL